MVAAWSPTYIRYIGNNVDEAIRRDAPCMVMLMRTYGATAIEDIIRAWAAYTLTTSGDTRNDSVDLENIAKGIVDNMQARTLCFAAVLSFFHRVQIGEFELYGCKPVQVLNAFNRHCTEMRNRQDTILAELENNRKDEERKQRPENALSGEELARWKASWEKMYNQITNN